MFINMTTILPTSKSTWWTFICQGFKTHFSWHFCIQMIPGNYFCYHFLTDTPFLFDCWQTQITFPSFQECHESSFHFLHLVLVGIHKNRLCSQCLENSFDKWFLSLSLSPVLSYIRLKYVSVCMIWIIPVACSSVVYTFMIYPCQCTS